MVDHHLRAVGEITELCFPQHQRLGKIAAIAVFEAEYACFGKSGVDGFESCLFFGDVFERDVFCLVLHINQYGMPLIERAAAGILPREPHRRAIAHEQAKRQRLRKAVIDWTFAKPHFRALLEQFFHFGMHVKIRRRA